LLSYNATYLCNDMHIRKIMDYDLGQIQCTQVSNHEIKLAANTQSKNY
jgi:hypothetical protein